MRHSAVKAFTIFLEAQWDMLEHIHRIGCHKLVHALAHCLSQYFAELHHLLIRNEGEDNRR